MSCFGDHMTPLYQQKSPMITKTIPLLCLQCCKLTGCTTLHACFSALEALKRILCDEPVTMNLLWSYDSIFFKNEASASSINIGVIKAPKFVRNNYNLKIRVEIWSSFVFLREVSLAWPWCSFFNRYDCLIVVLHTSASAYSVASPVPFVLTAVSCHFNGCPSSVALSFRKTFFFSALFHLPSSTYFPTLSEGVFKLSTPACWWALLCCLTPPAFKQNVILFSFTWCVSQTN